MSARSALLSVSRLSAGAFGIFYGANRKAELTKLVEERNKGAHAHDHGHDGHHAASKDAKAKPSGTKTKASH